MRKGIDMMRWTDGILAALAAAAILVSCTDAGNEPASLSPVITAVIPDSGSVGDTIRIVGSGFGSSRGSSVLTIGGVGATGVIQWTDTLIRTPVPSGAVSGVVQVSTGSAQSNAVAFRVLSATAPSVSFSADIQPIFNTNGCTGCHGSSGGLSLAAGSSYGNLVNVQALMDCTDKKRVLPGNADESVLYRRLSGSTCGDRMPKGGSAIPAASLDKVRGWINAGAPNN